MSALKTKAKRPRGRIKTSQKLGLLTYSSLADPVGTLSGVIEISFEFNSKRLTGAQMHSILEKQLLFEDSPARQLELLQLALKNLPDYVSSPVKLKVHNIT